MKTKAVSIQSLALDFLSARNESTYKILMKRLKPGLKSHVYKFVQDKDTINDILSKTFISAWCNIHQYKTEYNFSTWIYKIAKNECLGYLNYKSKTLSREQLADNHSRILKIYSSVVNMDMEVIGLTQNESFEFLYDKTIEEIYNLEEPYKTVLIEREIKKTKYPDIAKKLGWNINTVRTRIRKGRNELSNVLKEKYPEIVENYLENEN